ncbi:Carbon-monoxide dehydrogenase medium subunit [Planctomycetales bacterium 10988]|nr:Carbon-monoxide dehydrogenase medium subunit [Planctomycetales bacterium 10988]
MDAFDYVAVSKIEDAIDLLNQPDKHVCILAGGTDLIVQLREGGRSADLVVDIKKIPELKQCSFDLTNGLRIGAAVSCGELINTPAVKVLYPGLLDAARIIGGWQIQSRATLGGNLCNASPAADSVPALIVHGAQATIAGPQGQRSVPVEEVCLGPGRNSLQAGELLISLELPPPPPNSGGAYLRMIPRYEMDIAIAGCGAWLKLSDDQTTIEQARLALAAVGPTAFLPENAIDFLPGKPANEETFSEAARLVATGAKPISDLRGPAEYRLHLCEILSKRSLMRAFQQAAGQPNTAMLPT